MQTQVCPVFRYLLTIAPATAASRSASSKTMKGALPPSSIETFFTVAAHCSSRIFPTAVEPVKVSLRTSGLPVSSAPMARAEPVSTLMTPAGMPARWHSSASASAENGVWCAGLQTMVQPAASAGASLRASIAEGKFHGVMAATTPTGCLMHDDAPIFRVPRYHVAVYAPWLLRQTIRRRQRHRRFRRAPRPAACPARRSSGWPGLPGWRGSAHESGVAVRRAPLPCAHARPARPRLPLRWPRGFQRRRSRVRCPGVRRWQDCAPRACRRSAQAIHVPFT